MSIAETTELVKFHLSLNVAELARSIEFYKKLFGQAPAKLRCDYAKFELNEPPVVLSLIPMMGVQPAGRLNHIGIRLLDSEALVALQARLEIGGCPTTREDGVECCYSKQTKFWITDPDGTLWEFYILHAESDTHEDHDHDRRGVRSSGNEVCPKPVMNTKSEVCPKPVMNTTPTGATQMGATPMGATQMPASGPLKILSIPEPTEVVRQHLLTQPLPASIEYADESVDQWQLHGTLNKKVESAAMERFFQELVRTLKSGGGVSIHMVTADRPLDRPPNLPGPASLVEHVPTEAEAIRAFEQAGLTEVRITKLNDKSCFVVGPAEVRETKIEGTKPVQTAASADTITAIPVLFLGPLQELRDDFGFTYRRGVRTMASPQAIAALRSSGLADRFTIFDGETKVMSRCGG